MNLKNKILILVILTVILASVFIVGCISDETKEYDYFEKVGGINVYSDIPVSEVENWDDVRVIRKNNTAVILCYLELSAVSKSNYKGPEILIEESDKTGIYIHENSAEIKGKNGDDIMDACHIFVCLKKGITCPENLNKIKEIAANSNHLNVILDNTTKGASVIGYLELMEAVGYFQSSNWDAGKKTIIFPYLKENNKCKLQPFLNDYQIINETVANASVNNCNISGIFIQKSDKNEIKIDGEKIILSGDDEHLHSEEIIVSDILAPDLRLRMHK